MALPHLDVSTFPSQIVWLSVATITTYIFNKFLFIPAVSGSIIKRHKLIKDHIEQTERLKEHIYTLHLEIKEIETDAIRESKYIIGEAIKKSQSMLLERVQNNNKIFTEGFTEYEKLAQAQKDEIVRDIPSIVDEIKEKIIQFVSVKQ